MRKQSVVLSSSAILAVALGLIGVRCGSFPMGPSSANPQHMQPVTAMASTDGIDIGGGGAFPTWNVGGAQGDFRVHPMQGAPPLTVHVNMCHSTDPSPGISLHYHVNWGDGSDDHGF